MSWLNPRSKATIFTLEITKRLIDGLARELPFSWPELIYGMVRLEGFEPPTLGSVDRCSNPLSYSRIVTDLLS